VPTGRRIDQTGNRIGTILRILLFVLLECALKLASVATGPWQNHRLIA